MEERIAAYSDGAIRQGTVVSRLPETVRNFVWDQVDQFAKNLSSKRIANWVFAALHSLGATFHAAAAFRKTRNKSFVAASSFGKWPRVLTARRSLALSDSIAFEI